MEIWDRERAFADNGLNIELDSFALKMRHKSLLHARVFSDETISPILRAAQTISNLLQTKMESAERVGRLEHINYQTHQFDTGTADVKCNLEVIDGP